MNVFPARRTLIWGLLSLLLGAALLVSLSLAGGAVGNAERGAQRRAEDYTNTVLYKALSPALVSGPIEGRDYGNTLIQVQAGILSDDDVVRVRVWNGAGLLVFSSDQRDRLGQQSGSGGVLQRVLHGTTVSEGTGARVPPQPGLAGSNEKLLRTYVPLRLGEQTLASAVAEIDQRYSAILARANALWRPVQIAIGVGLLAALAMVVRSIRGWGTATRSGVGGDSRAAARARSLEKRVKELERRAKGAEDRAQDATERVDAISAVKAALEQQLANSERNLRDTLSARRSDGEDAAATAARVPELERELAELRARTAAAESIVPGATAEELTAAQARATAAEQRVAEADARAAEAERRLAETDDRSRSADQAQADLDRISVRLSETQAALAESTDKLTRLQTDLERVQQEKSDAVAELERAGLATGERDQEVERLRSAIAERDERAQQLQQTILERNAELEQLRSGLGERSGEAEHARAEAAARATELDQLRAEAIAKNAELDALRLEANARGTELMQQHAVLTSKDEELTQLRAAVADRDAEFARVREQLQQATTEAAASTQAADGDADDTRRRLAELEELRRTDVAEVQQAHEQLANSQLELTQARQRIEELEERARQMAAGAVSMGAGSNGSSADGDGLFGEHGGAEPPVFEPPDEATVGSRLSAFRKRRHAPRVEEAPPPPEEQWQPPAVVEPHEPEPQPAMPEISAEGLSLRERLTRAAAARHRVSTPPDREDR